MGDLNKAGVDEAEGVPPRTSIGLWFEPMRARTKLPGFCPTCPSMNGKGSPDRHGELHH